MKVEISLFRFDKDFDYLPYYKTYFITLENETTLLNIFDKINSYEEFSYIKDLNFDISVNGIFCKLGINIKDLIKNFGTQLRFDSICERRVIKDFIINDDDFNSRLAILNNFIHETEKQKYQNLKHLYYASNTLNYEKNYIGDAILILAYDIIEKNEKMKNDILQVLETQKIGAVFHTSLENKIFNFDMDIENKIYYIQKELNLIGEKIEFKQKIDFNSFDEKYKVKHTFKDFKIAYFSNNCLKTKNLLEKLEAKFLNLDSLKFDLAKRTFNINPRLTLSIASTILLDAFDNGADFVLVDNDEDFSIFDFYRKEMLKYCSRDILIPIIHKNELQKLAIGDFAKAKTTLEQHFVNPEII